MLLRYLAITMIWGNILKKCIMVAPGRIREPGDIEVTHREWTEREDSGVLTHRETGREGPVSTLEH